MDLLNTRRGLMATSNNISRVLRQLNLLHGLEWEDGYVTASGNISRPDSIRQEVVTDFIPNPFLLTEFYLLVQEVKGNVEAAISQDPWFGISFYDADKKHVTRTCPTYLKRITTGESVYSITTIRLSEECVGDYCRVSFRSFGDSEIIIVPCFTMFADLFQAFGASAMVNLGG